MAERVNPLDSFKSTLTDHGFKVPARPRISDFITQHGFTEGMKKYDQADEEWARALEKQITDRAKPSVSQGNV